jgi:hypothetical protein
VSVDATTYGSALESAKALVVHQMGADAQVCALSAVNAADVDSIRMERPAVGAIVEALSPFRREMTGACQECGWAPAVKDGLCCNCW